MSTQAIQQAALFFPVFLLSLCVHEWAHAWAATKLGDATPKYLGRLSLSPFAHADPMGTFFLPLMLVMSGTHIFFGWAKPVPVNDRNFRKPMRDMAIVAAAGPASNVILAILFAALGGFLGSWVQLSANQSGFQSPGMMIHALRMMQMGIMINLFLAVFNMIPLGPLDGAKVLHLFVPRQWNQAYERFQAYGGILLFGGLMFGWIFPALSPFRLLAIPVHRMSDFLYYLFGF